MANDHYRRYKEDVKLMKDMGANAYRFSISWPRIFPNGTGQPNPKGLDFYSRLVDELLRAGIAPFATLYHWDLPQALQDKGGWQSRETSKAFAEYAGYVAKNLSDRVRHFFTLNEFQNFVDMGHRGVEVDRCRERSTASNLHRALKLEQRAESGRASCRPGARHVGTSHPCDGTQRHEGRTGGSDVLRRAGDRLT